MGIIAVELAKKLWDWALAHWREAGWLVALLFVWLWHGVSADLTVCKASLQAEKAKPPVEIQAKAAASQKSNFHAEIVWPKKPDGISAPCPDVVVDGATLSLVEAALKEKPAPCPAPEVAPYWGLELSGGVPVNNVGDSSLGGSVLAGPWRFGAEYSFQSGPRAVLGHRWMFK